MTLRLAITVVCCCLSLPALAQTADTPVMGSSAGQEQAAAGEVQETTRILVLGDAVGGGLGAGLTRMSEADGRYDVTIRFNEESGLARPEVYDWAETLPKILESSDYDVIAVLIGTNDRQMIRSGNERFAFNTPGWIEAYKAQVDRLLDELVNSEARIYWVSIPPMKDAEYDAAMRAITEIQRQKVDARGMTFLDIRPQFSTSDGRYTDIGADDSGQIRKLRGQDGVSFFKQGNNKLGQLLLQAIARGGTSEPKTANVEVPSIAETRQEQKPREVPLFGQRMMLGDVIVVYPKDVTVNATLVAGAGFEPSAALKAIKALAPPGSAAEKLFRMGESEAAPKGRADDFSIMPTVSN